MKSILSTRALERFNSTGFVRTGISIPDFLLGQISDMYGRIPATASNWKYFFRDPASRSSAFGRRHLSKSILRKLRSWRRGPSVPRNPYEKSIYGSSRMIPLVLNRCLEHGLSEFLGEVPLLVGHDILLEGSRDHSSFGLHHDGFGWDIFFQTGDDLTLYIPLQDLNEETGGRLCVESHPMESALFEDRNDYILRFVDYCRKYGAVDQAGRVTREAAERCENRERISTEYKRVVAERDDRVQSYGRKIEMTQIDAKRGEVVLFNNKYFHDVENWKHVGHRSIYIIRCFPLYRMGLVPPSYFLNDVACNRYVIDPIEGSLRSVEREAEDLPFVEIPV